jgi:hypothetical protein
MRGTMRERRPEGEGRCSPYCNATGTKSNKNVYWYVIIIYLSMSNAASSTECLICIIVNFMHLNQPASNLLVYHSYYEAKFEI